MDLKREIGALEDKLDPTANRGARDELVAIRRGLDARKYTPAITLPNLKLGFKCKQRWEDMVGDERVRACGGCDRPVFNLSEMTRAEAERVLATRGLTPCVRFYRRPDGTVMTTDCPSGERREKRKLAVVASSIAAGTFAMMPNARAEPPDEKSETSETPTELPGETIRVEGVQPPIEQTEVLMGEPLVFEHEMGVLIDREPRDRPRVEVSLWGRFTSGVQTERTTHRLLMIVVLSSAP
jgi:hypothetical protein